MPLPGRRAGSQVLARTMPRAQNRAAKQGSKRFNFIKKKSQGISHNNPGALQGQYVSNTVKSQGRGGKPPPEAKKDI